MAVTLEGRRLTGKHGRAARLEEVQDAAESISDEAYRKLRAFARPLLFGTNYGCPEDLLHDAILAALEGNRTWYMNVPFEAFLYNAMRSIVSNHRTRASVKYEQQLATTADDDSSESELFDSFGASTLTLEEQMILEEAAEQLDRDYRQIEQMFADDEEVQLILMGKEDGLSPSDIQAEANMSVLEYEAASKRLRRGIAKKFGNRSKA